MPRAKTSPTTDANCANAARSTGTRSAKGKSRSAAVRFEDVNEIAELCDDAVAVYRPVTAQELVAVGRIAIAQQCLWSLAVSFPAVARLKAGFERLNSLPHELPNEPNCDPQPQQTKSLSHVYERYYSPPETPGPRPPLTRPASGIRFSAVRSIASTALSTKFQPHRDRPFQLQQPPLQRQASPVPHQLASGPDHPVAGYDNRDRIRSVGRPDSPNRLRRPDGCRDLQIAPGFPVRNRLQLLPASHLKPCASHIQRHLEFPQLAVEIGSQLLASLCDQVVLIIPGTLRLALRMEFNAPNPRSACNHTECQSIYNLDVRPFQHGHSVPYRPAPCGQMLCNSRFLVGRNGSRYCYN